MPPEFTRSELEIIGAPRSVATSRAQIDPDSGRVGVDHAKAHEFAFRVPSLRNVALTAPYMHNGVYRTLEQVIDFYDRGGGAGIGETLPSQTLDGAPLRLTTSEKAALVAFLETLTDTSQSVAKP
jgi:cytochrome c peroxidase